jgi:hypothetical protein
LSANIRLGWKRMTVTNTISYYSNDKKGVKKFIGQAPHEV